MPVYTPVDPPSPPSGFQVTVLTPAQEEMLKKVLAHFSKDYHFPGYSEGSSEIGLMEEEKFWLVSSLLYVRALSSHYYNRVA